MGGVDNYVDVLLSLSPGTFQDFFCVYVKKSYFKKILFKRGGTSHPIYIVCPSLLFNEEVLVELMSCCSLDSLE